MPRFSVVGLITSREKMPTAFVDLPTVRCDTREVRGRGPRRDSIGEDVVIIPSCSPGPISHSFLRRRARLATAVLVFAVALPSLSVNAHAAGVPATSHTVSPIAEVSRGCAGQNAEVEQAVDPLRQYVYEEWMGCRGIGFARSTDGGLHFETPIVIPDSAGSSGLGWDPAITVGPHGSVYVAFMFSRGPYTFPVVAASFDHGMTFPQVASLTPPVKNNWGDRDFIAAAPDGTLYVTWDYGPSAAVVTYICTPGGSCAFATGDLNVVIQKSTDGGRTWGPILPVSPGFPASGGDSGPLVVEPDGRIDVLYQGYQITNPTTYTMNPAHTYFTSSTNRGATWSAPVLVGADRAGLTMSLAEWWIDGAISIDAAGNLYATWDTQSGGTDVGWIAFSTDHGKHWSQLIRVTPDQDNATHIVQVAGASAGTAYVGWLTDSSSHGWAEYLRVFSLSQGWLTPPVQVSGGLYGDPSVWPGDTFGISTLSADRPVISWGSAARSLRSQIYAAVLRFAFD
jgi:hypothetical protein